MSTPATWEEALNSAVNLLNEKDLGGSELELVRQRVRQALIEQRRAALEEAATIAARGNVSGAGWRAGLVIAESIRNAIDAPPSPQAAASEAPQCSHPSWKYLNGGQEQCEVCGAVGRELRYLSVDGAPPPAPKVAASEAPQASVDDFRISMRCEDCNGAGTVGPEYGGSEFQPPELDRCESCEGSGWHLLTLPEFDRIRAAASTNAAPDAEVALPPLPFGLINEPMTDAQVQAYARAAVLADRKASTEPVAWQARFADGSGEWFNIHKKRADDLKRLDGWQVRSLYTGRAPEAIAEQAVHVPL